MFGIDSGDPNLMARFSAFGSNSPIGIELPLQTRAIEGDLIDEYVLFSDKDVLKAFEDLEPSNDHLENARKLSNYNMLPQNVLVYWVFNIFQKLL